jgi:pimeloyl-ACP methyl ester carboxylesterase
MNSQANLRAEVGVREPVIWVETRSGRLAVSRQGRGLPVLCLHAIGHGGRDFEDFARCVGDSFEIIAFDWPGQGRSPPDGRMPTAAHYEAIALEILDALKIERAALLGNSIGGAAALRLAAHWPARAIALVLCNSGGLGAVTPAVRFIVLRMAAFFRAGERGAAWYPAAFAFYYRHMVLPRAREQGARIIASAYEIAPILTRAWEGFASPESDLRDLATKVACPVLFAWTKSDRILAWSRSRKAARRFRDRTVCLFRGGHSAFLEDPEKFAQAFRRFAQKKNLR